MNKKVEKVNNLADDAKEAESLGHDTENQLSNNLISITLAFVALLATAISTSNVLGTIGDTQKILIMASIIVFCLSIFVGLFNYYLNMRFHQKSAKKSQRKAQAVKEADTTAEVSEVERPAAMVRSKQPTMRNNRLILAQIVLLGVGLILCVTFIGMMLFVTSFSV